MAPLRAKSTPQRKSRSRYHPELRARCDLSASTRRPYDSDGPNRRICPKCHTCGHTIDRVCYYPGRAGWTARIVSTLRMMPPTAYSTLPKCTSKNCRHVFFPAQPPPSEDLTFDIERLRRELDGSTSSASTVRYIPELHGIDYSHHPLACYPWRWELRSVRRKCPSDPQVVGHPHAERTE